MDLCKPVMLVKIPSRKRAMQLPFVALHDIALCFVVALFLDLYCNLSAAKVPGGL